MVLSVIEFVLKTF